MAVVLAAIGLFVYLRVGSALLASVDQTAESQLREAARHVAGDERGLVDRDVGAGETLAQRYDRAGRPVQSTPRLSAPLLDPAVAARVAAGAHVAETVVLGRPAREWRVRAAPLADRGGAIAVARSLEPREETLHRLLRELLIAAPLALLLASLAGYGLAAAALRPVEAMRRRAEAVTARSPGRLPVPASRDEVSRLAITLNAMLARLEAAFEHERRFVADASHELRTPLALLRAELELALRRPRSHDELAAAVRSAADETERLSRLAEDLLLLARLDQGALPIRRRPVQLDELFEPVARRFARTVELAGRRLVVAPTPTETVDVDPDRIQQALSNLVENAVGHGAGDVDLSARVVDGRVELHVADRGPGFPAGFVARAFDRFSRADEARARGGAGLGLSIVRLVAEAHGGSAGAADRPGGGADVWLSVPRPTDSQRLHSAPSRATHLGLRP